MINPGSKTRIMFNGGVSYVDLRSEQLAQQNGGWQFNVMAGVQQTLPWDLRLSANVIAMGGHVSLQGSSTGMSMAMLGLTKTFLNDRLSVGINGVAPISKDFKLHMGSTTRGSGFTTTMNTAINMAQVAIQVSWTFGKQGNQGAKRVRRTIENDSQLNSTTTAESMNSVMQMQ